MLVSFRKKLIVYGKPTLISYFVFLPHHLQCYGIYNIMQPFPDEAKENQQAKKR
uniref:Uncharacterized protein n=1 Tax=Rhizophora mucronata TaxID=61149 RepID=A0A2P2Q8X8_RHIMU